MFITHYSVRMRGRGRGRGGRAPRKKKLANQLREWLQEPRNSTLTQYSTWNTSGFLLLEPFAILLSGNAVRGSCATGVVQSLCSTELCLLGECELEGTIRCSAPVVAVYSVPISPSDFLGMEVQHSVRMV